MKYFFTTLLVLLLSSTSTLKAEQKNDKAIYKFGGVLDLKMTYDTYQNKSARSAIYFYPVAPTYDNAGHDLSSVDELIFTPYATKLNFSVSNLSVLNADTRIFIEGDFLGTSDSSNQMFRMRHAFVEFNWDKFTLLAGQTFNLNFVSDVVSPAVDMGGGFPYYVLNRGMQLRANYRATEMLELRVAAEMFEQHKSVGPADAQINSGIPAVDAQIIVGDKSRLMGGLTVGTKYMRPRTVDESGFYTDKMIASYSISGFFKAVFNTYKLQAWGIYGSNLTHLNLVGGYGKVAGQPVSGDYDLANVRAMSTWIDFDAPLSEKLRYGVLFGYQENMGSNSALDISESNKYGYFRDTDLEWAGRIAPRVNYYASPKLILGVEYSYNAAQWAKQVDEYMKPIERHELSVDNRFILSILYVF